jgi:hypothetical protein
LSKPLENTSALLPLLPVIGYWVAPPPVSYSLLMLVVGTLYAVMATLRRSFLFGLLAALAANVGLWHFLARAEGLGIVEHPQLWLIPPALCLLVAAHWNRDRLRESQLISVRYFSSAVIYGASTADIFLNGVAQSPWLPLVLMGLSIAGVLAGILLRIRAFLFLGVAFLLIAMLTIIWYAAVDLQQTWLWYVVGIVTGAAMLALFAVFERKRQEVLQIVEQLREWDA